jgi:hypothetical protein
MNLVTYQSQTVQPREFIDFWARHYSYRHEELYTKNIGRPLTSDSVHELFVWKNGGVLSSDKRKSVDKNYVNQLAALQELSVDSDAATFLTQFPKGGAIWRIFWLHCWQPCRFPVYDQHVHRAMVDIEEQRQGEIPQKDAEKVHQYLSRYLPFHAQFQGIEQRRVDKALWFYGKFRKSYPLL